MDKVISFFKTKEPYYALCRYFLGGVMISYGLLKMNLIQCNLLPFSAWQQPMEKLVGVQFTWAFLGYSSWFEFLIGLFEFAPAVLLFYRRTSLLGAILIFPMTLSVFLINQAMDLWAITKQLSSVLLLLNCLLIIFDWEKIKTIASVILQAGKNQKNSKLGLGISTLLLLVLVLFCEMRSLKMINKPKDLYGDWRYHHPFEWNLVMEKLGDSTLPLHPFRSYFMPVGTYSEINEHTPNARGIILCEVDEKKHLLTFDWIRLESNVDNFYHFKGCYNYSFTPDSLLMIQKIDNNTPEMDSSLNINHMTGSVHSWFFKKRVINQGRW